MGSNMQRQAVPLLVTEAPLVATGLEGRVALDSRAVVVADESGKVASVNGSQVIVTGDGKLPETKKKIKQDVYKRQQFPFRLIAERTNKQQQRKSSVHRP